ncbi:hypothetical protein GA830_17495 [Mesorhizobium sp. NBSH29]|uniref:hypothetical protein n=1 Tax=Mesorhizobium sp. NBSH29 TaxID=2654249 RepID=UPI001896805B|nr:hypothetical protein [Mesorhizobium sp. NBSH29]QPC88347.1 hypothetical protein GA830_17495 [Mesorhizobium sp. NBSH29]
MFHTLKAAAVSALIGFSALTAMPVAAQAQEDGIYLQFGNGHRGGAQVEVYSDDDNVEYRGGRRHREERRDWREDRRGNGWRHACSPDRALDKAERMGLRRVRIVDVNRRTISVAGRSYRGRQVVTFARAPRCPVVG